MFIEILRHTPAPVWGVLALLVVLGASQMRTRTVGLRRTTVLPLVFVVLSLAGVVGTFGHHAAGLLAWALGLCAALALLHGRVDTRRVRYAAGMRRFTLPGSVWPLLLMLSIFAVKFAVAVALIRQPGLQSASAFALAASAAYGFFSGALLGRAMALWALIPRRQAVAVGQ